MPCFSACLPLRGARAMTRVSSAGAALLALALLSPALLRAQDNYEIQVYGSPTVPTGVTMIELHSNFTASGRRVVEDGMLPTDHAVHETLEITHGFTDWFEVGGYLFTSARDGQGWQWVGDHIRPRVRVPDAWHWPIGASLSMEVGYQRPEFSADTWSLELRPILDKQLGRWYASLNPTLERSLRGPAAASGFEFSPNVALAVDVTPVVNLAAEYYGAFGPLTEFDPVAEQEQQLFGAVNLNVSPAWEINAGLGRGFTTSTDRWIVKLILGRRLGPQRGA